MPTYMKADAEKMLKALETGPKTLTQLQAVAAVNPSFVTPSDLQVGRQVYTHLINSGTIKRHSELAPDGQYLYSL